MQIQNPELRVSGSRDTEPRDTFPAGSTRCRDFGKIFSQNFGFNKSNNNWITNDDKTFHPSTDTWVSYPTLTVI